MPEEYSTSTISLQQLDVLLADLELGPVDAAVAMACATTPDSEIPQKGNDCRSIPKKGNSQAPNPPKFGNKAFPFLGISGAPITVEIPKKGNGKTNHHGRDFEKDKRTIKELIAYRPAYWMRASVNPAKRFLARTAPITGGDTSLHPKPTPKTNPTTARKSTSKTPRPSTWNDTTPLLKAVSATMALQEAGEDLAVFRMTPHRDLVEKLRRSLEDPSAQSPADHLRRRIVRHIENEVGRVVQGRTPEVVIFTEVSPTGTFHVHGVVTRRDSPKLRKALRLAGDEWDANRQFQLRVDPGPITPGWAIYAIKELGKELSRLSMSQSVTRKAREFYELFRSHHLALARNHVSHN